MTHAEGDGTTLEPLHPLHPLNRLQMQDLRDQLGMPKDSEWACIDWPNVLSLDTPRVALRFTTHRGVTTLTTASEELQAGCGLWFELFGRLVPPDAGGPVWRFNLEDVGRLVTFQAWVMRAKQPDSPLVAQILWRPDFAHLPRKSIEIESDRWDAKAVRDAFPVAIRAMAFLHDVRRRQLGGGRPKGSKKGRPWPRRQILEWVREASHFAIDREPTLAELGAEMGVSPDTARARVRDAGLQWPPTDEELAELEGE